MCEDEKGVMEIHFIFMLWFSLIGIISIRIHQNNSSINQLVQKIM